MFEQVTIKNFKSIRDVNLHAKRVNLFIGEPNTGKSNLLEALALLCGRIYRTPIFKEVLRVKTMTDLFWDQDISNPIAVQTDTFGLSIREKGLRLELKPMQLELLVAKEVHDELFSYPWDSVPETLRRIVFYRAALETNKDAILLLDEPESNTFPFYTKYLAERIALDLANQFFVTTHNPYLLSSIVEKTDKKHLAMWSK